MERGTRQAGWESCVVLAVRSFGAHLRASQDHSFSLAVSKLTPFPPVRWRPAATYESLMWRSPFP
jgi:hypothetical protein